MPQRSELPQQPATTITSALVTQLEDAELNGDYYLAHSAIVSFRASLDDNDHVTNMIASRIQGYVMCAFGEDYIAVREEKLRMAYELAEIGWRDSIFNKDNEGFELAAGADGKARLTVIDGGKL